MIAEKYLTVKEAAELLGVHWQTVRRNIKLGKLQAVKFGKVVRIPLSQLQGIEDHEIQEIELRYRIDSSEDIQEKLRKIGAVLTNHNHVIDHYYCPSSFRNIEDKNRHFESSTGYAIRIRQLDLDYSGKLIQTLEVKKLGGPDYHDHSNCLEAEIDIQDFAATERLLLMTNNKKFITIDKERFVYRINEIKFCLDEIKGFGKAIEIELKTSRNPVQVRKLLKKYALLLDLTTPLPESLTYEAMEKMAKF